ncbi:hypothetical protein GUITHDRAFT_150656 [Guillardia theta CCMP2712]|uniref:Uncharacterized protein n=2 Tax=Guillardia theta TaxID=55529 RepID=L1JUM4_GUITC|nr:hypothetical protein GUITHDRAFT_150656 [Guillardia theta CCMP2712]EKX52024.1 hypothetical protein GUITHDRAFT_150656 [Guillardia theta CCMP2712]|eukprot:XP_005839004.1 hypothetical protein GUITHDRAFT_150656 [Guillardia theta CCMP2712]
MPRLFVGGLEMDEVHRPCQSGLAEERMSRYDRFDDELSSPSTTDDSVDERFSVFLEIHFLISLQAMCKISAKTRLQRFIRFYL